MAELELFPSVYSLGDRSEELNWLFSKPYTPFMDVTYRHFYGSKIFVGKSNSHKDY